MSELKEFRSRAELDAALPAIEGAARDAGRLDLIVVRPGPGQRELPDAVEISAEGGVAGDHWAKGCWLTDDAGHPHRDVQICMMASPVISAIAGDISNWPPAGDNLFIDMDLSPDNMPPGTRFALGTAELVVTEEPHKGCQQFIDRYGRDACVWVNTGRGRELALRGIYARVVRDGRLAVGDRLNKLS